MAFSTSKLAGVMTPSATLRTYSQKSTLFDTNILCCNSLANVLNDGSSSAEEADCKVSKDQIKGMARIDCVGPGRDEGSSLVSNQHYGHQ
jgi:hypothetical protein